MTSTEEPEEEDEAEEPQQSTNSENNGNNSNQQIISNYKNNYNIINAYYTPPDMRSIERPFVCDWTECGKRYKTRKHLNEHKRIVHLNERRYECDYNNCRKEFFSESHLTEHKRIHSEEKPFICDHEN